MKAELAESKHKRKREEFDLETERDNRRVLQGKLQNANAKLASVVGPSPQRKRINPLVIANV